MDDGAYLFYKLTYEPKGSGELISRNQSPKICLYVEKVIK